MFCKHFKELCWQTMQNKAKLHDSAWGLHHIWCYYISFWFQTLFCILVNRVIQMSRQTGSFNVLPVPVTSSKPRVTIWSSKTTQSVSHFHNNSTKPPNPHQDNSIRQFQNNTSSPFPTLWTLNTGQRSHNTQYPPEGERSDIMCIEWVQVLDVNFKHMVCD